MITEVAGVLHQHPQPTCPLKFEEPPCVDPSPPQGRPPLHPTGDVPTRLADVTTAGQAKIYGPLTNC